MRTHAFERQDIFQTIMVSLLTLLSLTILAVMCAYWTWVFLSPSSASQVRSSVHTDNRMDVAYGLFGITPKNDKGIALAAVSSTFSSLKLLGIVSGSSTAGHRGYALIKLNTTDTVVVHEGENISPGVRLAEVTHDHLVLERGGSRETLTWSEKPVVNK